MGKIEYNLNGLDLNRQFVYINNNVPRLSPEVINNMKPRLSLETMDAIKSLQTTLWRNLLLNNMYRLIGAYGVNQLSGQLSNTLSNNIFGNDTLTGQAFGQIFSSGINSASDTLSNNILKGQALSDGLLQNTGASVAGTAAGVTGNLIGRGINDLGGDSMLSRGIGQGIASGIGTFGGAALSNIIKGKNAFQGFRAVKDGALATKEALAAGKTAKEAADIGKAASAASKANLVSAGMSIAGSALGAAFGPSKEYSGKYGSITRGMDTAYDIVQGAAGLFGPVGMTVSGIMALNKGLSNVFGSTSGMTRQDAILGSAFMPAPVKWLNVAGAKTTDKFSNQSWLNLEKSTSFMQDAFGDLQDKFDKAREEARKTYGTFSRHAYNKAQGNVEFANRAWGLIMDMADLNELQNIRSLYMTSINNQRYAQDIMGGFHPLYRGKQGMKIFNNTTNHNIGMRLLSAAALIDNKAMILSALGGTKVKRPKMRPHGSPERTRPSYMTEEEWNEYLEDKKRFEEYKKSIGKEADYGTPYTEEELQLLKEYNALKQAEINLKILERNKAKEEAAARFNKQVNTVMGAMTLQANETPFTGLEYQQAAENLRQEKVEKFHKKAEELEKGFNAALMADLAVSAAPLLLRGFRWIFNKAGKLVRVPKLTELFSQNLSSEKFINPDGSINVQEAIPEIVKGKNFAIEYLNSPVRAEVNTHNKKLADRLGFKLFKPFNEAGLRVSTPSNLKIVRENSSIGGSVSTDSKNPAADLVTINLYNSDPYYASMHENLHRGYLGNAPKEYFLNETRGTFGDTNRFYDYLKDKLLKPWSERFSLPGADYLDQSAELAVNMFEVGQRMGLKVGLQFPGKLKVLELLEKYKNSGDYKSGVIDHLNLKHPLRIWKALTGTFFSLPLIYGTVNNTIGQKAE